MNETIFKINLYFFSICFSLFTVSSEANYEEYVENAFEDLRKMEIHVINQKIDVNGAWDVEDEVSDNWDDALDEVRLQSMGSAIEKYLGDGLVLTAARLLGFFETDAEKALKDHYRLIDLSTFYSDVLEALKEEIEIFNSTVSRYKGSHKVALQVVKLHEAESHDSPSEPNHTVSSLTSYTCRDNLPSFSCRGNYLAGKTVCDESYNTPNKAFYTHQQTCGDEEDENGNKTLISGDGIHYYTCDPIEVSKHRIRECKLMAIDRDGNEDVCGESYRRCMKLKYDHDLRRLRRGTKLHSDSSDESADAGDSDDDDEDATTATYHVCDSHESWQSGDHSRITPPCGDSSHSHIELFACQTGSTHATQITGYFGTFYECQPHTTYGCGHTDLTINSMYHVYKVSCTTTNGVGVCTGTNFYICQHTDTYPVPPPPAVFTPSLSLTYTSSTGSVSMTATANAPIIGADLYIYFPDRTYDEDNKYGTKIDRTSGNSDATTYSLPVNYSFPASAASGTYKFTLRVYPFNNSGLGDAWGVPYDVFKDVTVD